MNRTIKFRAWDNKNKKWITEVPYLESLLDDTNGSVSHHDVDEEMGLYFYPNNPMGGTFGDRIIYQQLTGLKDKDNRDVYEGDILKVKSYDGWGDKDGFFYNSAVFYSEQLGRFLHANRPELRCGHGFARTLFEVVGNIFENPELINS